MSDDESDTGKAAGKLSCREEFAGWKESMSLIALDKGDADGIFTDDGSNPAVGYQAYGGGVGGNAQRREWMKLAKKLVAARGDSSRAMAKLLRAHVSPQNHSRV